MADKAQYLEIDGSSPKFFLLLFLLGVILAVAAGAWYHMEHSGHYVTGMNNQVVWGMPHIFAIFLIVAASGALNVASISSVFGKTPYKPLARMSGLLAITLLVAGLIVLVLDLGRPDRLIVAMTYYNFKSIFAWNIFLYTGFMAITAVYLWMMMERKMNGFTKPVGTLAFVWRLLLTTGTGSIFGFIVARQGYDAAVMAPMFVIMSFAYGLAMFNIIVLSACKWTGRPVGTALVNRLKGLLGTFVAAVLYFILVYHLTKLYATQDHGFEAFVLRDGGIYTSLFWWGVIGVGGVLPLALVFSPMARGSQTVLNLASLLVILGGFAWLYVIIIGGQAFPMQLFPGYEVSSSFGDGEVASYSPSLWEFLLGLGGIALAIGMITVAINVLRFLPVSLADSVVDPHVAAAEAKAG